MKNNYNRKHDDEIEYGIIASLFLIIGAGLMWLVTLSRSLSPSLSPSVSSSASISSSLSSGISPSVSISPSLLRKEATLAKKKLLC